ncbi:hypothetical protein FANTH_14146 [Fusarium anthophilum]|uniref:Uncharacterized protein n=1 Tax=Fusarium anthophilum TaxID=48485 RepID=A0A8H4YKF2_9HYPO|nr:hypothetical protein FANTH_14146 [Fusarium anthophilum]
MASTARTSTYDSDNQHRRSGSLQDQDENWSDSSSDKQPKQTKSPKRNSKLRHKLPEHYRQHTSESASQFPDDSYMRQARNATVPYSYDYDPSYSPSYQAHINTPIPYLPSHASQAYPEYPDWHTYPRQGSHLSVPRARNPFVEPSGRSTYANSFRGYPESGYGFGNFDYDQDIPPPPEYPTQDPLRTPVRPREPEIPKVQQERDTGKVYRDEVEKKPRKERSPTPEKAKTLPEDNITKAEIMEMLTKKEKTFPEDKVTNAEIMEMLRKIQQEVKENAEIQSDPGRREYREHRNLSPTSQPLLNDTTSVEIERLKGFIHGLLEDRRNQDYQDSYSGTSRSFADSRYNRIEMDHRESVLIRQRDFQSLQSRLDHIIDRLDMPISPHTQQLLGIYNNRQSYHVPRRQVSPAWDPSMLEPTSPILSRPPSGRNEYIQPIGNQRQDTQASVEARPRQQASCIPEEAEVPEEYPEAYGDPRVPIRGPMQGRPLGPKRSNGSRSRGWSQPSVGQRSELRGLGKRIAPGDQHKVTPGRDPIVEFEDQLESEEEPIRDRTRMPYLRRPRAPGPPAPDPPAPSDWRNM